MDDLVEVTIANDIVSLAEAGNGVSKEAVGRRLQVSSAITVGDLLAKVKSRVGRSPKMRLVVTAKDGPVDVITQAVEELLATAATQESGSSLAAVHPALRTKEEAFRFLRAALLERREHGEEASDDGDEALSEASLAHDVGGAIVPPGFVLNSAPAKSNEAAATDDDDNGSCSSAGSSSRVSGNGGGSRVRRRRRKSGDASAGLQNCLDSVDELLHLHYSTVHATPRCPARSTAKAMADSSGKISWEIEDSEIDEGEDGGEEDPEGNEEHDGDYYDGEEKRRVGGSSGADDEKSDSKRGAGAGMARKKSWSRASAANPGRSSPLHPVAEEEVGSSGGWATAGGSKDGRVSRESGPQRGGAGNSDWRSSAVAAAAAGATATATMTDGGGGSDEEEHVWECVECGSMYETFAEAEACEQGCVGTGTAGGIAALGVHDAQETEETDDEEDDDEFGDYVGL